MLLSPLDINQTLAVLHIPKTAGTSLVAQISQAGVPWAHILNARYYPEIERTVGTARDHLIELKPDILAGTYRLIFGHMTRRDVIYSLNGAKQVRFAAFIRDPVSRFISEYKYAISPNHPDNVVVLERYPNISAFVETCVDNNVLTHYLERYRGQPVKEIVDDLEQDFCFLGLVEDFNSDVDQMMNLFSIHKFRSKHLNRNVLELGPVSEEILTRIRELNARDVELYNLVASKWFGR